MNPNKDIIPIFSTQGSVGKSILTAEDEEKIDINSPVSIFSIAKENNLKQLYVIDNSFLSFPQLYKISKQRKIQLIFGVNFTICNNVSEKSDESLLNNCQISVLMKNSEGYEDLIKLNNAINCNIENFYYSTRGSWDILRENMTDNLLLIIPPFDSFIHKNLLEFGNCIPNLSKLNPVVTFANMELPWNEILNKKIIEYATVNNYQLQEVHPIYYYSRANFKAYSTFRCIANRSKLSKPEIPFFCKDTFCWEKYKEKTND